MARSIEELKKQIAEAEGFPLEKVEEFVALIGDEPYITSAGLQFKMLQKYRPGKFAVQALIPSREEYALLRRMMGLKEEEPLVVMRGEVWVEGFDRPFVDYGTATPKNLKGFVRFSDYPLEMATRRATNRAMRLATATGMCSVDEIKDAPPRDAEEGKRPEEGPPADAPPASREQVELIRSLGRSHLLTEEERAQVEGFLHERPDKRRASTQIGRLKSLLDARRNGAACAPAEVRTEG